MIKVQMKLLIIIFFILNGQVDQNQQKLIIEKKN